MIVGVHHIAIGVSDLDTAIAFYTEAFGFDVVQTQTFDSNPMVDSAINLKNAKARMAMLKTPNNFIELWEYQNPPPKDLRSEPNDLGYPHFALQVREIDKEYERLKACGMTFGGEPVHFSPEAAAIYGKDPFGNIIELYQIDSPDIPHLEEG
ncbi:MAG: glyoxylase I family protein [Candidatus Azotimanducaceae bacterium]|jgi:glyoxylase I family protein